jgi:catechol 2,3-dioxygenase
MPSSAAHTPTPTQAQTPRGVNHLVLNVRDLEESHRFWTELIGFRCVAELKPKPGRTLKMRFYSGVRENGDVSHHDLALAQIPDGAQHTPRAWSMTPSGIGINHVAICYPDRDAWLRQVAFLRERGVQFHLRVDHGMTHSVYISDPNGHGIEILYELPREVWEHDIEGAQNYSERFPPDDQASLVDSTDYPRFGTASAAR